MGDAQLIPASDKAAWMKALSTIHPVDVTMLPAYHSAYALRVANSRPYLWHYQEEKHHFVYPLLLTPVNLPLPDTETAHETTGYYDISSAYGYTGAVINSEDSEFKARAWQAFDAWSKEHKAIAEFTRFSPYLKNHTMAHPDTQVVENRLLAVSHLPSTEAELLTLLGPKTRNMLRKAERSGLTAQRMHLPDGLAEFRALYDATMRRNDAEGFFYYDDAYYEKLLQLGAVLQLYHVFSETGELVAAAMAVVHGESALYHLGASIHEYARLGAGNLALFTMSCDLMARGVRYVNMTGGRSAEADDPLLLFKKNNATGLEPFYIGKRILDTDAYEEICAHWEAVYGTRPSPEKVIFWRK